MRRIESELDMTPMVDVTFLLLIFFMVTASFSLQRALETPHPNSDLASNTVVIPETLAESLRLHVAQDGSFLLMADDWQKELVGKQSLVSELVSAKRIEPNSVELKIQVESEARLQSLVDAMDAATIAGFDRYQLTETDAEFI
ncbi:MAG: biopolymer transporter ExbD [Planctomycetales bacterium]|nr:biopolymer transporter ExbD [Planctomycetales bacterium]